MKFDSKVSDFLLQADNKALATFGRHGLNVVPVSTVFVVNEKVWLINYFLKKTLDNIINNRKVALTFWKGMSGYQIKGTLDYKDSGKEFEEAKNKVAEKLPDRIVKGLLIISPEEVFDISP